jgi:large subunit ribosomal protein L4
MAPTRKPLRTAKKPVNKRTSASVRSITSGRRAAEAEKKQVTAAQKSAKMDSITLPVVGTDGKAKGRITVSKKLFGKAAPPALLAQSVRVSLANKRQGTASTKTRGLVAGSTRKIYRQKGTGRARHGGIRAPIFVGGGIVHGPKPRDYRLKLPLNMKRRALTGALHAKIESGNVVIVDGLEGVEPKTRVMAGTLSRLGVTKSALLVVAGTAGAVVRAAKNIGGVDVIPAHNINAYALLTHEKIIVMKDAVSEISETFGKS